MWWGSWKIHDNKDTLKRLTGIDIAISVLVLLGQITERRHTAAITQRRKRGGMWSRRGCHSVTQVTGGVGSVAVHATLCLQVNQQITPKIKSLRLSTNLVIYRSQLYCVLNIIEHSLHNIVHASFQVTLLKVRWQTHYVSLITVKSPRHLTLHIQMPHKTGETKTCVYQ